VTRALGIGAILHPASTLLNGSMPLSSSTPSMKGTLPSITILVAYYENNDSNDGSRNSFMGSSFARRLRQIERASERSVTGEQDQPIGGKLVLSFLLFYALHCWFILSRRYISSIWLSFVLVFYITLLLRLDEG